MVYNVAVLPLLLYKESQNAKHNSCKIEKSRTREKGKT